MKMIAGAFWRAIAEEPPDPRRAQAREHLDEGPPRYEVFGPGLMGDGLGQERLARAGGTVQQDPTGHPRAERLEPAPHGGELHDLLKLVARLVGARDLVPADRLVQREGLISCGFVFGMNFIMRQRKKTMSAMKMIGSHR